MPTHRRSAPRRLWEWFWGTPPPPPHSPGSGPQPWPPACAGCGKRTHNLELLHGTRPHMPRYCRECAWDIYSDPHYSGSGY